MSFEVKVRLNAPGNVKRCKHKRMINIKICNILSTYSTVDLSVLLNKLFSENITFKYIFYCVSLLNF